jgi:hypothetical protein
VRGIVTVPSVALYSVQPLALAGPGLTVQSFPASSFYHYRYNGLRLLYVSSGTYYLLPVGWTRVFGLTYIITQNDQIRIVVFGDLTSLKTQKLLPY